MAPSPHERKRDPATRTEIRRALCYLRAGGGAAWKMRELGASLSRRPRVSAEVQAAWSEGLINAVPGPSTVVLLIIGLAGMAARNWCRRKV